MVDDVLAENAVNGHVGVEEVTLGVDESEVGCFLLQGTSEGISFPNPFR